MSNITTDSINGNYPIAGQDNSSQGFRDNFTSIKNNLTIAKNELTELQNKVVLKSALTGITLDNDFNYTLVKDMQVQGFADRIYPIGTISGAVTVDFSLGHVQTLTTSGTVTLSFTNIPTSSGFNMLGRVKLLVYVANTAHQVKIPTATIDVGVINSTYIAAGAGGDADKNIITFPSASASIPYILEFSAINTTPNKIYLESISELENKFVTPVLIDGGNLTVNADELLEQGVTGSACSLSTHATLFVSGAGPADWAVTLGAGSEGQIKVLALQTDGGAAVKVAVTNGAWGANTNKFLTLSDVGAAVTLQYLNSKWFAIGNNGATFTSEVPSP